MSRSSRQETETVGFLLVPQFPMLAFSAAIEPLRIANWLSGRTLYDWRLITEAGGPVIASNGIPVVPHTAIWSAECHPLVLTCAGMDGRHFRSKQVFAWLRKLARADCQLGGIAAGAFLLARAGLLHGHRCTVHWEERENFRREFPGLEMTDSLYEIDRNRLTCPGGTAALDMMLYLIEKRHGRVFAGQIADEFIQHRIRNSRDPQRMSLQSRTGISDARLLTAVEAMENHIEEQLTLDQICKLSDLSLRHLQRLFMVYFKRSPTEFYREMRLQHARQLLLQGAHSILDVAVASGFVSGSHFSRRYRAHFGRTPGSDRMKR